MNKLYICMIFPILALVQGCAMTEKTHLVDRALISEQVSRYAQLWDRKDAERFSQLFAQNGVMDWRFAGSPERQPVLVGRANILRYVKDAHETRLAGKQSRHHFTGLIFEELSESAAVTEHTLLVTHTVPTERPKLVSSGIYRIKWEKTGEEWLIAHRTLFLDR